MEKHEKKAMCIFCTLPDTNTLWKKIEEDFTAEELALISQASESFHKGEGINWKKIKRE